MPFRNAQHVIVSGAIFLNTVFVSLNELNKQQHFNQRLGFRFVIQFTMLVLTVKLKI